MQLAGWGILRALFFVLYVNDLKQLPRAIFFQSADDAVLLVAHKAKTMVENTFSEDLQTVNTTDNRLSLHFFGAKIKLARSSGVMVKVRELHITAKQCKLSWLHF